MELLAQWRVLYQGSITTGVVSVVVSCYPFYSPSAAYDGVIVTAAAPVMVAEALMRMVVSPAALTCHCPLAVVVVTAVRDPSGQASRADHVVPPSAEPSKVIVPVHVPENQYSFLPLLCPS